MSSPRKTAKIDPALQFSWSYLAPRYWGSWLILGLLWLLMFLPRPWLMSLGAMLGDRIRKKNRKRRRIVEVNLQLCFPEFDDQRREDLCQAHFHAYGRGLLDMGLAFYGSKKRILRLIDVEGFERHRELLKNNRVLVVAWHLTTMEVGGNILGIASPTVTMMKPMNNPLFTWQVAKRRSRMNDVQMVTRKQGMRPLLRGLREGKQCVLFPDEDFEGAGDGATFVPFFGVQRLMVTTPGRLAKSVGAKIVTCATSLDGTTGRYRFVFSEPLEDLGDGEPEDIAIAISRSMEGLLKAAPEQYMWTFRWFRSRPNGEPSPYDPVPTN